MSSFCYAPWSNIDITPTGTIKPCCKFKYINTPEYNIYKHDINDYINSKFLFTFKQQFLNDTKPPECERCWNEELNNIKSKRILDHERWNNFYTTFNLKDAHILTISLAFGNICNLKCRICSSISSSKWIKEEQVYNNVQTTKINNIFNSSLLTQLDNLLPNIIHLDFPGGEPLISATEEHLYILDWFIYNNKAKAVSLHYTTNLTIFPEDQFWHKWKHFKNVDLQVSIDGIEKHFEYNRYPADWKQCYTNLKKFQTSIDKRNNMQLSIAHTLSIFTIYYLPEFFKWCINEGVPEPWIGRLSYPYYYQPGIIPTKSKHIISNKLQSSTFCNVQLWKDEVFLNNNEQHLHKFHQITKEIDNYRKQSFQKTFPELAKLL